MAAGRWRSLQTWANRGAVHRMLLCYRTLHFNGLADAAGAVPHATCMAMDASAGLQGDIFIYRIGPGRAGRSCGLRVAALAGMPVSVLVRTAELLAGHVGGDPASRQSQASQPLSMDGCCPHRLSAARQVDGDRNPQILPPFPKAIEDVGNHPSLWRITMLVCCKSSMLEVKRPLFGAMASTVAIVGRGRRRRTSRDGSRHPW